MIHHPNCRKAPEDGKQAVRPEIICAADGKEEHEGDEVKTTDELEAGVRQAVKMLDPLKPSKKEIEEHALTHLPFRNWCRECVHGRGSQMPHKRGNPTEQQMRELHCDFMFLGPQEAAGETIPVLVIRESVSKMVLSAPVPSKSTGTFVAKRVIAFLSEIGCLHGDVVVRSDQEPAMVAVVNEVGRLRAAAGGGRWIVEHSPVGSSASNGVAERAIQAVQQQVRVLKLAIEERWGAKIPHKHPAVPWIIEYAGFLLNRFEVSNDGKTAYERFKGRKARVHGIEFGEAVHWRRLPERGPLGKLESLWGDGIYLGVKGKTGEIIVGDKSGVFKTRTVRRKALEDRWRAETANLVTGVPWKTSENDKDADGEDYEVIRLGTSFAERPSCAEAPSSIPRNAPITKHELEIHGYTSKCPGCAAILKGTSRQGHSEACRKRFNDIHRGTEKFKKAEERKNEFVEKAIQRDEEARKRRKTDDRASTSETSSKMDLEAQGGGSTSSSSSSSKRQDEGQASESSEAKRTKTGESPPEEGSMDIDEVCGNDSEDEDWAEEVFDTKTGDLLDPDRVRVAREEELKFMDDFGIFEDSTVELCYEKTGKPPIDTKWVDVDKGAEVKPEVRSRLVARDFKPKGERPRGDLFAAMPPLEAR